MPTIRPVRRLLATPALALGAAALTFGAAAPPEHCPDVTTAEVDAAARAATAWMVDNQQPDGTYLYEYDRSTGRTELFGTGDYNIVRHAGVVLSLYMAARHEYPGALEAADRGVAWALDHTVERHGWIGITTEPYLQAGTNALMVAALVERREATGSTEYDEVLQGLGRFLTAQLEPNGALLAYYDVDDDRPWADTYSIYYSGEAWWALARLHRTFPDDGWGAAADLLGNYLATERDHAEDLWPPLADHWSGYGLGETAQFPDRPAGRPLTDTELSFVERQGGIAGQRVRSISQRFGPWGTFVRGTFTPRGGGYGVFGEGLGGLWRAAQADDRLADLRAPLAERQVCIVGLALEAQVDRAEAATYDSPGHVAGAWFQNEVTRMDDQQHAVAALFATIPILDSPGEIAGTHPNGWLWLVAVVGVFNPVLGALAVRRADRRIAAPVVAAGAAAGALVLFLVGALSGWLLGAVGVSSPSMRLAAAGLCGVATVIDLAVGPRRAAGAVGVADGWAAALTPVAIPNVIRVPLVIAGWSVVADHGLAFYGLALLIAAGTLVLAATAPGRLPEPVAGWAARLLTALGLAASLLLVTHAVFDV